MLPLQSFPAGNLPPAVRAALAEVAGRLAGVQGPWAVGGGAMLAGRGLPVRVKDLDLFAEPETARRVAEALGAAEGMAPAATPAHASAFFARTRVAGVDVDVIGGFARACSGGIYRVPVAAASVDAWLVGDGWRAPLQRAEEWLVLYWLHPKGDGREPILETYLRQGRLDRHYLEEILNRRGLPESVREQGWRFLMGTSRGQGQGGSPS